MKIKLTSPGLIVGAILASALWLALGSSMKPLTVAATLVTYLTMSFAFSLFDQKPSVTWIDMLAGLMVGLLVYLTSNSLGLCLFFTSCIAALFSLI